MNDRRTQIPLGCAINIKIIDELSKTDIFKNTCKKVPRSLGIIPPHKDAEWPFFNFSWGAYMMYSLFVVSKELYNLPKEDEYYQRLVNKNAMNFFDIKRQRHHFEEDPKYHFNSFRNSVSHVNYTLENNRLLLWDHPPSKSSQEAWHWWVEIDLKKSMEFLGIVAQANIELYNEINSGKRNLDGTKKKI